MRSVAALAAALGLTMAPTLSGAELDSAADVAAWYADTMVSTALTVAERTDVTPTFETLINHPVTTGGQT